MRLGVFVGSFDPFTIGHKNIVDRVLPLFDKVVVGIGVNANKKTMLTPEERAESICNLYADDARVVVKSYSCLTTDFARTMATEYDAECVYIIKGVRSLRDFEYERDQADINRQLSGIETLLLYSDPLLSAVSSSVVRELHHFGKDVSAFLPGK